MGLRYIIKDFKVKAIDTTGAGDAFIGAAISRMLSDELNITKLLKEEGQDISDLATWLPHRLQLNMVQEYSHEDVTT